MTLFSRFDPRRARCREVGRQLQSYLDSELDEARRIEIHAHLDACRDCGLEFSTYHAVKDSLSRRAMPVSADTLERLRTFSADLVID